MLFFVECKAWEWLNLLSCSVARMAVALGREGSRAPIAGWKKERLEGDRQREREKERKRAGEGKRGRGEEGKRGKENQQQSSNRPMVCIHPTAITLESILEGKCKACGVGTGMLSMRTSEKNKVHPI